MKTNIKKGIFCSVLCILCICSVFVGTCLTMTPEILKRWTWRETLTKEEREREEARRLEQARRQPEEELRRLEDARRRAAEVAIRLEEARVLAEQARSTEVFMRRYTWRSPETQQPYVEAKNLADEEVRRLEEARRK